jgi:phage baseplate assembly protein W
MDIRVPYHFDSRGQTATTTDDRHLRDLVKAVLFTRPGERVNRPDFGCGLFEILFQGGTPALATTVELSVQASLQRWLGELIEVRRVAVQADESTVTVEVSYLVRVNEEPRVETFEMRA